LKKWKNKLTDPNLTKKEAPRSQQAILLHWAKFNSDEDWPTLAEKIGISLRSVRNYLLASDKKGARKMGDDNMKLVKDYLERNKWATTPPADFKVPARNGVSRFKARDH
jgi:hypothetical protein